MPGYGCLCGGCRDCLIAQGYDPDRDRAEDDAIEIVQGWLRDADKIGQYTAYLTEDDCLAIERAVAEGDAAALLRVYEDRLAGHMHDDAVDQALSDIRDAREEARCP